MGDVTLRADPNPERAPRSRNKLPAVRAKRPRRRLVPAWLRRGGKPALIGIAALVLLGGGFTVVRLSGGPLELVGRIGDGALTATGVMGLKVHEILVEGRSRVAAPTVMATLGVRRGEPILAVGVGALRARLEAIPWVESAVVERRLPDTIFVRLTERQPLALWQHNGHFSVIDAKGVTVTDDVGEFANLPIVVGDDAPPHAEALLLLLGTSSSTTASTCACPRRMPRRRGRASPRSSATTSCCRATSWRSICVCPTA